MGSELRQEIRITAIGGDRTSHALSMHSCRIATCSVGRRPINRWRISPYSLHPSVESEVHFAEGDNASRGFGCTRSATSGPLKAGPRWPSAKSQSRERAARASSESASTMRSIKRNPMSAMLGSVTTTSATPGPLPLAPGAQAGGGGGDGAEPSRGIITVSVWVAPAISSAAIIEARASSSPGAEKRGADATTS